MSVVHEQASTLVAMIQSMVSQMDSFSGVFGNCIRSK